ncbi:MAG TPA: hypothetical protein VJL29_08860 [Thermoguttaceae bacterium]|nr:hypothetical protein [Thermoguttaceae bacterium]
MRRPLIALSVMALLVGLAAGCGDRGPTRYRVSGTVTFQGKPVPLGAIQFTPDTSKGNRGPAAFAGIKNGRYDTAASGQGFVGGPQVVTVDAFDGVIVDPDLLPSGKPLLKNQYRKSFDLPKDKDAPLDIELSE